MGTPNIENLYNPEITDLELNEHQGINRPVVYLDQAKALLKQVEVKGRVNELEETVIKPMQGRSWLEVRPDIEFVRIVKRYKELKKVLGKNDD